MGDDPETKVIGAYLEGIKNGSYFFQTLGEVSRKKPVILWKVGLTSEGRRAASSHTGALTSSREIWEAVVRQNGAIPIAGFDALLDTMMGFSMLPSELGDQVAILSGPGGFAVAAAEACGKEGLRLAKLTAQTRSALAEFVPPTGTSLANPIDVGLTASLEMDIYVRSAEAVAADPGVDAVVVIGGGMSPESNQLYMESMIRIREESQKPFIIVGIPGFDPTLARNFCNAGLPFFETSERAMSVYARMRRYQVWRRKVLAL
jgi:acyl-CoA synthetase (NDP forming)